MPTLTPLPTLKAPTRVRLRAVPFLCVLVMVATGVGWVAGASAVHRVKVPQEAVKLARVEVEAEMRAACSPWYTDKRGQVVDRRIVVCKAPDWLVRVNP